LSYWSKFLTALRLNYPKSWLDLVWAQSPWIVKRRLNNRNFYLFQGFSNLGSHFLPLLSPFRYSQCPAGQERARTASKAKSIRSYFAQRSGERSNCRAESSEASYLFKLDNKSKGFLNLNLQQIFKCFSEVVWANKSSHRLQKAL